MEFDPSKPFEKENPQVPQFDPNQAFEPIDGSKTSYLDQRVPYVGGTPRGYIQGTLNALPYAGAAAGGVAGTAAGPLGSVAGAGLGAGAGGQLKKLGEHYILGKDQQEGDYIKAVPQDVARGVEQEMAGQAISKLMSVAKQAPGLLKKVAEPPTEIKNTIYDPFLKQNRTPGQTIDEIKNVGTKFDSGEIQQTPGLLQKGADIINEAIDKGKNAWEIAKKDGPEAIHAIGAIFGHLPGYAAAKVATSPLAGKAAGAALKGAGQALSNPTSAGLLEQAVRTRGDDN